MDGGSTGVGCDSLTAAAVRHPDHPISLTLRTRRQAVPAMLVIYRQSTDNQEPDNVLLRAPERTPIMDTGQAFLLVRRPHHLHAGVL